MQAPFVDPLLFVEERPKRVLPLVGRLMELSLLRHALETVSYNLATGPRAITISGEMGVGKTRLLAQLCWEARERGFRVLEAKAYEASRMFPYFPFIEALRPALYSLPSDTLQRLLELQPQEPIPSVDTTSLSGIPLITALVRLFPDITTLLRVQPHDELLTFDQEKFRLFDAIATFLERLASEQPVLLAIDNLQWADSASQELTLYLTVRLQSSRVLLVGVTRPPARVSLEVDELEGEISDAPSARAMESVRKILLDLMQQGLLLFLPLSPLSTDEATEHLRTLLPGTVPPSVSEALLTRAGGNPFFLEELVRTLTIDRQLVLQNSTWKMAQTSNARLPDSIVLAVRQRLQGLSSSCRGLLSTAALFGNVFPVDALLLVVGENAQAWLDEAEQALLVSRVSDIPESNDEGFVEPLYQMRVPRYAFCQGIVHEVLQANVPAHRLRALHYAIAQALETCYGHEARTHAAELATHYVQSGEKEPMLCWSLLAGEEAIRQQAYREAISHLRLVVKLVEAGASSHNAKAGRGQVVAPTIYKMPDAAGDIPTLPQLYLTIGELWFMLGELEQATASLQHALESIQEQKTFSALLLARINRVLADVYRMQAKYEQAMSHLQMARQAIDKEARNERHEQQEAVTAATMLPWFARRGLSANVGTVTLERMSNNERVLLLQAQATLDIFYNRTREAEQAFWQSHQLATRLGDRSSQAFALHMIGWICGWSEHIHESLRLQKQAQELYIALGDPLRATLGDQGIGIIYLALGEIKLAKDYTQRGFERIRRYGVRRMLGLLHWNEGMIALTQGDWAACEAQLQQAMHEANANNDTRLKPLVLQAHAELYFRRGQWQEAEHAFQDAIQAAASTEWFPGTLVLYGHFLAVTGRRAAAQAQFERARTEPESTGMAGSFYIPFLAEGYLHLDTIEHAMPYVERIKQLRGFLYFGISVDRILGELATLNKDWPAAEKAFEDGLRLCQRAGNQPEEATILYEQARMALMRGDALPGIECLCTRARTLFLQYNMQRSADLVDTLLEGVRALKDASEKEAQAATTQSHGIQKKTGATDHVLYLKLSAREREVLQLVAEGHTDREVADILVLSHRTINRHLSNIFVKLDVPGRAAAVAYAIRNGLV